MEFFLKFIFFFTLESTIRVFVLSIYLFAFILPVMALAYYWMSFYMYALPLWNHIKLSFYTQMAGFDKNNKWDRRMIYRENHKNQDNF